MGLLTVDVNSLGVVMTSDSQKVDLYIDHFRVNTAGAENQSPIRVHGARMRQRAGMSPEV